ncbi:DUF3850 domain-containing protein [Salmonella enterica]
MSTITKEPVTHNLKIWPEYFSAVRDGLKRAELRWNDREYQAGDILDLCEWDPNEEAFTGDFISVAITHVAELGQWMPGYVLLSVAPPAPANADPVAWLWSHRKHPSEVTLVRPEDDDKAEAAQWSGWSCQALYAAPPAPVSVPDEYVAAVPTPTNLGYEAGWNACRAAMLQSAEHVSNRDDRPEVVLHMGQAMSVFEALKKEVLSEHVRHAERGAMGAVNVQVWTSVLGGTLQYETSNGGCTLRVITAAPLQEVKS